MPTLYTSLAEIRAFNPSVAHLKNTAANADAAAYANAAANAAANATTYAAAANATYAAANAAAYAAAAAATYAAAAAYNTQKIKNKEFLIQAIQAYENGEL